MSAHLDLKGTWIGTFSSTVYKLPFTSSLVRGSIEVNFEDPTTTLPTCRVIYQGWYRRHQLITGNVTKTDNGFVAFIGGMTMYITLTKTDYPQSIQARYQIDYPYDQGNIDMFPQPERKTINYRT